MAISKQSGAFSNRAGQYGDLGAISPQTIGEDAKFFVIENATYVDEPELFSIALTGEPLTIVARNIKTTNCGPLFRTASNAMASGNRDIRLWLENCDLDAGYAYKCLAIQSVGIEQAMMQNCRFTRAEKAAVQFGEADLFQTRRNNINFYNCKVDGVLDREDSDEESHGIFLLACQNFVVDGCSIHNINSRSGRDVDCEGFYSKSRDGWISNCDFFNAGLTAISLKGNGEPDPYEPADPDQVRYGDRITVVNNRIRVDDDYNDISCRGILLNYGGNAEVNNNFITNMEDNGIVIEQPDPSTGSLYIRNNMIEGGAIPIYVRDAFSTCFIEGNRGRNFSAPAVVRFAEGITLPSGSRNTDNVDLDA